MVVEGAGSPAEPNLARHDLANMRVARLSGRLRARGRGHRSRGRVREPGGDHAAPARSRQANGFWIHYQQVPWRCLTPHSSYSRPPAPHPPAGAGGGPPSARPAAAGGGFGGARRALAAPAIRRRARVSRWCDSHASRTSPIWRPSSPSRTWRCAISTSRPDSIRAIFSSCRAARTPSPIFASSRRAGSRERSARMPRRRRRAGNLRRLSDAGRGGRGSGGDGAWGIRARSRSPARAHPVASLEGHAPRARALASARARLGRLRDSRGRDRARVGSAAPRGGRARRGRVLRRGRASLGPFRARALRRPRLAGHVLRWALGSDVAGTGGEAREARDAAYNRLADALEASVGMEQLRRLLRR
mgnify:CR=1 FL=1